MSRSHSSSALVRPRWRRTSHVNLSVDPPTPVTILSLPTEAPDITEQRSHQHWALSAHSSEEMEDVGTAVALSGSLLPSWQKAGGGCAPTLRKSRGKQSHPGD